MKEIKIIFDNHYLIFEVNEDSTKKYYKEKFDSEYLEALLRQYLSKLYKKTNFHLSNSFIKQISKLKFNSNAIVTLREDFSWFKDFNSDIWKNIKVNAENISTINIEKKEDKDTSSKIKYLKDFSEHDMDNDKTHFDLALELISYQKFEEAIDELRECVRIKPNKKEYYFHLAKTYELLKKYDLAILEYKEAINLDEDYWEAFWGLGNTLSENGRLNDAILCYHSAIAIEPEKEEIYLSLGKVYNKLELYNEAIYTFENLLALNPNDIEAKLELEKAFKIKKKVQSAELNNLGIDYAQKNKFDKAIEKFQKAMLINPEDIEIKYNLAYAFYKKGALVQASFEFKSLLERHPELFEIHLTLGDIYEEQGQAKLAIEQYTNFVKLCGKDERKKDIENKISILKQKLA